MHSMNVKTYRARSMQEALALVREELGAQASVLQTRQVRPRGLSRLWEGGRMVEVVASRTVSVPSRLLGDQPIVPPRSVPSVHAGIDLSMPAALPSPAPLQNDGPVQSERCCLPLVVVTGAMHGVGTTTVALNLALALARQGRRVVLVDADLVRGGRLSCLAQRDGGSILDVLAGRRTVHEVLARGPAGVQILPGGRGSEAGAPAATWLVRQLHPLVPHCDAVVFDAGCSRSDFVRRLWQSSDAVWLTVTPADDAILKGYAAIKASAASWPALRGHAFVNRADARQAADVHARLAEACRRFLAMPLAFGGSAVSDHSQEYGGALGATGSQGFDVAADVLWPQLQRVRSSSGTHGILDIG
jgi:MinD-like ATPase involved in chromosome partitioning or flagellar assembly